MPTITSLHTKIRMINGCDSVECLNQYLFELTQQADFDHYQFTLFLPSGLLQSSICVLSYGLDSWLEDYWQHAKAAHDPLLKLALRCNQPIIWNELETLYPKMTEEAQELMVARREFGMVEGVTLPLHGGEGHHGMLNLSRTTPIGDVITGLSNLSIMMPYFFQKACELLTPAKPNISERERECMFWVSEGKTSWETATILGITERTVNFHLNSAIRKTGCKNRYQTIARNIASGQLRPDLRRLNVVQSVTAETD